jgi:nucleoside-diphosphate-sugar epimerase
MFFKKERTHMNLILGTGPLGMSVMQELWSKGEAITMVNTSGRATVPPKVKVIQADLMDAEQAIAIMKGVQTVYHCSQPPYHRWDPLFIRMQDHVIAGAIAAGAKLVAAENLYMYGQAEGLLHEELPYAAATKKGKIRAAMSRKLLELYGKGQLRVTMGRGSDFFGPGVYGSSVGERFFKPIAVGKACTVFGDPSRKHTYTYIDDFGKALVLLGQREEALGQVWHVPNAAAVTTREFAELACKIAGSPPMIKTMGRGMLRIGGIFIPAARESIEMLYQFEHDFVVDSTKFSRTFEIKATPLEVSIRKTLDWYRDQRQSIVNA